MGPKDYEKILKRMYSYIVVGIQDTAILKFWMTICLKESAVKLHTFVLKCSLKVSLLEDW